MKSRALRKLHLPEQAFRMLAEKAQYMPDPQLKALLDLELARCNVALSRPEQAHEKLTEVLLNIKPGPDGHQAACLLAEICLQLDKPQQALSVCRQITDADLSEKTRIRLNHILAATHSELENYEDAITALLPPDTEAENVDTEINTN
jgi:predicted Zn-dependent protease